MTENKRTGYLEVLVLDELQSSARTGYELMDILHKKLGARPSPGSMYPLLNYMLKSGLISLKKEGRKKKYSLTNLGKKKLSEKIKEKEHLISKHLGLFRLMIRHKLCTKNSSLNIIDKIKVSRKISSETAKLLLDLKEALMNSILDDKYLINEKIINKEINDAVSRINAASGKKNKKKCD